MNKKSYDELKLLYGLDYVNAFEKMQSPARLERLYDYFELEAGYVVADFACGNGMLMSYLSSRVKHYFGIDFSEHFVKQANDSKDRLMISNATFVCSDIVDFCINNPGKFDVGFALDFSEHVYDDEWLEILRAIKSLLKIGGKLYLHTPNADYFIEIMKKYNFLIHSSI
ncbi:MAG TPA: class I SAM-dependent methyltransferase [Proteobacteria bacterium]|nr:class I SAM-dependent methyltransferase [Pseudomonadota bacterium]